MPAPALIKAGLPCGPTDLLVANCAHLVIVVPPFHRRRKPIVRLGGSAG
jgi:hypothetical protein